MLTLELLWTSAVAEEGTVEEGAGAGDWSCWCAIAAASMALLLL